MGGDTTFGSRIAGKRRMLDRRQDWLAKKVGVTPRYISKLETNAATPSLAVVTALAQALETTIDFLVHGEAT